MALSQTSVLKLYNTVIDDVIAGVRDAFLDEGVDEQVLQEMKHVWTNKLMASKAVETAPEPQDQHQPSILANSTKANGTKKSKAAAAAAAAAANQENQNGATKAISNSASTASNVQQIKPEPANSHAETQNNQQMLQTQPPPLAQAQHPIQQPVVPQQPPAQPAAVVASLDPNKMVAIQITLPAQPNVPNSQPRVLTIQVPASALQENQLQQVLTGPIITSIMPLPPQIASSVLQQHVNSYLQNNTINAIQIHKQLDGAYDMLDVDVDTNWEDDKEVPTLTLTDVLDQQFLNTMTHSTTSVFPSASSSSTCCKRKSRNRKLAFIEIKCQLDGAVDTSDEEASDISDDNIGDDDDDDLDKEDDEDLDGDGGAEEEPLNSEDDVTDEDASDLFDTDNVVVCQYDKITRSRNKWKFYLKDGIMNITGKDYVFQKSNGDAEW
ncbi:transcription initiation factor IIA subunit 1 isoform X2 [Topomyia yanbarensis]|uniref:transcription initiation factor IIA subunit 1 isoform X2 n=1 Tax=Topomyia yanbarensis TaxID=2498891 RepID=UPI00273ADB16|nr:transcription initiation factor IIA subunit 1 isoform X2 [Topomyia yanbarensis]